MKKTLDAQSKFRPEDFDLGEEEGEKAQQPARHLSFFLASTHLTCNTLTLSSSLNLSTALPAEAPLFNLSNLMAFLFKDSATKSNPLEKEVKTKVLSLLVASI